MQSTRECHRAQRAAPPRPPSQHQRTDHQHPRLHLPLARMARRMRPIKKNIHKQTNKRSEKQNKQQKIIIILIYIIFNQDVHVEEYPPSKKSIFKSSTKKLLMEKIE